MNIGDSAHGCQQHPGTKQTEEIHHDPGAEESLPTDARGRWWWVERCVWTQRMLSTLEKGVKGGKWFSLIDKVYSMANLTSACERVTSNKGAAGVDRQTVSSFNRRREQNLYELHAMVKQDTYVPREVRRRWIDKLGSKEKRPLGIPAVRDRVVQTALRNVIEPIFEWLFHERSYGFRPGRGCHDALCEVERLLQAGNTWVVDADLKSYFDTIPHEPLLARVEEKISDGRIQKLIQQFLKQGIMDELKQWVPEAGTPQGAVISPLLANLYLDPLDKLMSHLGYEMIRYADDFVILCRDQDQAQRALEEVRQWTRANGLQLHPEKTRIVDASQKGGFDFLGYHFERGKKWPRDKSMKKLKDKIHQLTPRSNGHSLPEVIKRVNTVLRGWFGYFKQSHPTTFVNLDGWVRGRLRGILRKRRGGKGRARGADHKRWPIVFFERAGLYSTTKASERLLNPMR